MPDSLVPFFLYSTQLWIWTVYTMSSDMIIPFVECEGKLKLGYRKAALSLQVAPSACTVT